MTVRRRESEVKGGRAGGFYVGTALRRGREMQGGGGRSISCDIISIQEEAI